MIPMANATARPYLMSVKTQWRILTGAAMVTAAAVLPGGLIVLLVINVVRVWRRKVQARAVIAVRPHVEPPAPVGNDFAAITGIRRAAARLLVARN
jgi:hypothetical protein